MNEKVKVFYEGLSADEAQQAELKGIMEGLELGDDEDEGRAAVIAAALQFAKDHGYDLAEEDLAAPAPEAAPDVKEVAGVAFGPDKKGEGCGCLFIGAVRSCGCFVIGTATNDYGQESALCNVIGMPV